MISCNVAITTGLVSTVAVAYILGTNESLREFLNEAPPEFLVARSSVFSDLSVGDAAPNSIRSNDFGHYGNINS